MLFRLVPLTVSCFSPYGCSYNLRFSVGLMPASPQTVSPMGASIHLFCPFGRMSALYTVHGTWKVLSNRTQMRVQMKSLSQRVPGTQWLTYDRCLFLSYNSSEFSGLGQQGGLAALWFHLWV